MECSFPCDVIIQNKGGFILPPAQIALPLLTQCEEFMGESRCCYMLLHCWFESKLCESGTVASCEFVATYSMKVPHQSTHDWSLQ